jgi:hypothetical protein
MSCFKCSLKIFESLPYRPHSPRQYIVPSTDLPDVFPYLMYVNEPTDSIWYEKYLDEPLYAQELVKDYYFVEYGDSVDTNVWWSYDSRYRRQYQDTNNVYISEIAVDWVRVPDHKCLEADSEVIQTPINFEYYGNNIHGSGLSYLEVMWLLS